MSWKAWMAAGAAAMAALLASGCGGHTGPSAAAGGHATRPPSPTATPLTAAEHEWVAAIARLQTKIDKPFEAQHITMTRAKMTQLEGAAGGCDGGLRRLGQPGPQLQSAYVMAKKACRTYHKAARCFARAAQVSDISGAVVAGTPGARIQRRSLACGLAAQGNASNQFANATAAAQSVESRSP
jgi:hypothetical protein